MAWTSGGFRIVSECTSVLMQTCRFVKATASAFAYDESIGIDSPYIDSPYANADAVALIKKENFSRRTQTAEQTAMEHRTNAVKKLEIPVYVVIY